uniref:Uncharacterized protein n=1 Tax=Fagus sylvatica TaxID=28930 RepID=A0A2N9IIT3_FAGSY
MYGMRICPNGIWFGRQFLNFVRFWVSAGISASAIIRRYLFVIVRMDLNQWIQQIGTYMFIQEGVREEIPYNAQKEEVTSSSRCPTCIFCWAWRSELQLDQRWLWRSELQRRGLNGWVSAGEIGVFSVGQRRFWGVIDRGYPTSITITSEFGDLQKVLQGLNNFLVVEEKLQGGPWSHEQVDRDGMDSKGCCEAALQMEAWSEKCHQSLLVVSGSGVLRDLRKGNKTILKFMDEVMLKLVDRLVKAIVNDAKGRARGCNSAIASPKDRNTPSVKNRALRLQYGLVEW